jgi:hypothetical protein
MNDEFYVLDYILQGDYVMEAFGLSLFISFLGVIFSYLIWREFKIANERNHSMVSERSIRDLINRIDKMMGNDKVKE